MISSSENVFMDLKIPNPDEYMIKSKLSSIIQRSIAEQELTQQSAAEKMEIPQPKLSNILRGRLSGVSRGYLLRCLTKLGHDVDIAIKDRGLNEGSLVVAIC